MKKISDQVSVFPEVLHGIIFVGFKYKATSILSFQKSNEKLKMEMTSFKGLTSNVELDITSLMVVPNFKVYFYKTP